MGRQRGFTSHRQLDLGPLFRAHGREHQTILSSKSPSHPRLQSEFHIIVEWHFNFYLLA